MRSSTTTPGAPGLLLTVLPARELWVWTLTDGAGLARIVAGALSTATAEALSVQVERGLGTAVEPVRLGTMLFPGEVGECLAGAAPGPLTLQLHPSLDRLAWESAWIGPEALGQRFAVARAPLLGDEPGIAPEAPTPAAAALRGLRVLPAGHDAAPDCFEGETRVGSGEAAGASGHDVIFLPQADSDAWARLAALRTLDRRPGALVVATVSDPTAGLDAARETVRKGAVLLLARHDVAGGGTVPGWWASLARQLEDGIAPDVAVRQIRRDHAAARPGPLLRLFGAARTALRRPALRTGAQRRQVTALSVDIVDSTRLLRTLGAERYSTVLQRFHDLCADVMHRHGGVSDDPQGDDGFMNYFGHPVASEDAAPRAVAAGLVLVDQVAALGLQVRVGIATGPVVIQNDAPVGEDIHLAARLQNRAGPGGVLVSRSTRALLGEAFELEEAPEILSLKGIEAPQPAWRVLRRHDVALADPSPARGGKALPLVGRETELEALWNQWLEARRARMRVVLVQGEAGIGKSRLLRELRNRLEAGDAQLAVCRCLPDTRASAFFALATTLRRLFGLRESDDPQRQLEQLARHLPDAGGAAQALMAALLSLPVPEGTVLPPPERWREQTLAVLLAWIEDVARKAPLALLVEDTHWIDPSTREFLDRLVKRAGELPILLLGTHRSDESTAWAPRVVHERLSLRGLAPSAARWLVRQACGDPPLPADLVRLLAARTDGVPLFLEESVRMAVELRGDSAVAGVVLATDVPGSLHDLLMARIDRLGEAKPTAQLAATLGRTFPRRLLEAVAASEFGASGLVILPTRLEALEHAGVLLSSGPGDEARLTFRHALLRDTAYQSLWQRDRRRLHQVVAGVLTEQFGPLVTRQPELLAYHLAESDKHEQALAQWEAAARLAIERSANDEAIAHLESALAALARLPAGAARDRQELRLQTLRAARCIAAEGYGARRVGAIYARAAELAESLGDRRALFKVALGQHAWHFMRADFGHALAIAHRAQAATQGPGPPPARQARQAPPSEADAAQEALARIQARWSEAIVYWHQGRLREAMPLMDQCLAEGTPAVRHRGAVQDPCVMCACYSGWGAWELGAPDEALERVQRAIAMADTLDHHFSQGLAWGFLSSVLHFRGETAAALEAAERARAICDAGGFTTWLAHARMMSGRLLCEAGRTDEGLAEMQQAYALWVDSGATVTQPLYLAMQAEGLVLAGRAGEGLALLEQALAVVARTGERYHEAEIRRLLGEITLRHAGEAERTLALSWIDGAHELATAQGKRSFALRAALASARALPGQATARQRLLGALAQVQGGADTRDVLAATSLLQAGAAEDDAAAAVEGRTAASH